jgi:hypothetical protein
VTVLPDGGRPPIFKFESCRPSQPAGLHRYLWEGLRNPRELGSFSVLDSVSVCRIGQRKRHFGALSPKAIFGISFSPVRVHDTLSRKRAASTAWKSLAGNETPRGTAESQ